MPYKAKIRSGVRFKGSTAAIMLDLIDDSGAVVQADVQVNMDWERIQGRMDSAAAESPSRSLSPAQALEELIGEWVDIQHEVLVDKAPASPPDFSAIKAGGEIARRARSNR